MLRAITVLIIAVIISAIVLGYIKDSIPGFNTGGKTKNSSNLIEYITIQELKSKMDLGQKVNIIDLSEEDVYKKKSINIRIVPTLVPAYNAF